MQMLRAKVINIGFKNHEKQVNDFITHLPDENFVSITTGAGHTIIVYKTLATEGSVQDK